MAGKCHPCLGKSVAATAVEGVNSAGTVARFQGAEQVGHIAGRHIQGTQFALEFFRVIDQGQQIGEQP